MDNLNNSRSLNASPAPSPLPVRLTKMSSAMFYKKHNKHVLSQQLAEIFKQRDNHGKLPVEAAYDVMKRVTEAAGFPIMPNGISTYNKLQAIATEPAVRLLKTHSWQEFFKSASKMNTPMTPGSKHQKQQDFSTIDQFSGFSPYEDPNVLSAMLEVLIERIEILWIELKIPSKEQDFYRKTLFSKAPIESLSICKQLGTYVDILIHHKMNTKETILAIRNREEAVHNCIDVLAAIERKLLSNNKKNHHLQSNFWKEELIMVLDEVRFTTLEVIKRIQLWRSKMWRPHPFMWKGINYLQKMKIDMHILKSDSMQLILSQIPLTPDNLICICFDKAFSNTFEIQRTQDSQPPSDNYLDRLIYDFCHNIEEQELLTAAKIVYEDDILQQALNTEHQALIEKKVFIPLLRMPAETNKMILQNPNESYQKERFSRPNTATLPPVHQTQALSDTIETKKNLFNEEKDMNSSVSSPSHIYSEDFQN